MNKFKIIGSILFHDLTLFFKHPTFIVQKIWKRYILWRILNIQKDIFISIDWFRIYWPNTNSFFFTINEVFIDTLYKKLYWCKKILDLGWFIWESALYFARTSEYVEVYEVDPENFKYIQQNTQWNNTIKAYNIWVVAEKNKQLFYTKVIPHDPWWYISANKINKTSIEIQTKTIASVLKSQNFDWLKMDIEWSEYSICEYFIDNNILPFIKGYIEFHRYQNHEDKINIIRKFIKFLWSHTYKIEYEDVYGKSITFEEWLDDKMNVFVVYFEKNNA